MAQTSRYALPLLQAGQAQKEVTHNEAIARIDGLMHLAVESRQAATMPLADGAAWIVATGATGEWAGHAGEIAVSDDAGWDFVVPRDGCVAFVRDETIFVHFAAGAWRDGWPVPSLAIGGRTLLAGTPASIPAPSGGSVIDVETRAVLGQLLVALRTLGLVTA